MKSFEDFVSIVLRHSSSILCLPALNVILELNGGVLYWNVF